MAAPRRFGTRTSIRLEGPAVLGIGEGGDVLGDAHLLRGAVECGHSGAQFFQQCGVRLELHGASGEPAEAAEEDLIAHPKLPARLQQTGYLIQLRSEAGLRKCGSQTGGGPCHLRRQAGAILGRQRYAGSQHREAGRLIPRSAAFGQRIRKSRVDRAGLLRRGGRQCARHLTHQVADLGQGIQNVLHNRALTQSGHPGRLRRPSRQGVARPQISQRGIDAGSPIGTADIADNGHRSRLEQRLQLRQRWVKPILLLA